MKHPYFTLVVLSSLLASACHNTGQGIKDDTNNAVHATGHGLKKTGEKMEGAGKK